MGAPKPDQLRHVTDSISIINLQTEMRGENKPKKKKRVDLRNLEKKKRKKKERKQREKKEEEKTT